MKTNLQKISFIIVVIWAVAYSSIAQETEQGISFISGGKQIHIEEVLSQYIQIESVSGLEKEAGEYIRDLCAENGLHITQMGDANGNFNFAASIRPLSDQLPNIIFLNHIDVVHPGDDENWTYPPFSGEITKDEIWGRGSLDNKGPALIQLASILEVKREYAGQNIPYNVTFLSVSCEESQCDGGVKYVVENHFDDLRPAVVIGEGPPGLTGVLKSDPEAYLFGISVAHKRPLWIELSMEFETTGHGSVTPLEYSNREMVIALSRLLDQKEKAVLNELNISILKQLGELEKGIFSIVLKHPVLFKLLVVPQLRKEPVLFSLFSNTITLTNIDSNNEVVNVVPKSVSALLDCRLLPLESTEDFLLMLKKRLNNEHINIRILKDMPMTNPSSSSNHYYKNLEEAIQEYNAESHVIKMCVPNFNDAGIFRSRGVPAYSSLPVKLDNSYFENVHNYNERIPRYALLIGKNIYADFIKKCLEE